MTAPVRPPSDIHQVCQEHTSVSCSSWTEAWAHLLTEHGDGETVTSWPLWQVLATQ